MTNHERAKELLATIDDAGIWTTERGGRIYFDDTTDALFINAIEAALDEAEHRGELRQESADVFDLDRARGELSEARAILDEVIEMDECERCSGDGYIVDREEDGSFDCQVCKNTGHGPIAHMVKEARLK